MTENKRFTSINGVFYTDNETGWEFECYGEVADLLNALHEENEQLRKDREDLFYRERDTKNKWRELKQENEQLQSRIKDYDVALRRLQDLTDKKLKENDELKNKLNLILEKKYHEFIDGDIGNFKIEDLELKE